MEDDERLADDRCEIELIGNPRRKPDDPFDRRLVRRGDRNGTAHREPEQESPSRGRLADRGPSVLDAPVEPLPRLDAISHLREAELGQARGKPPNQPFDGRTPRSLDLARLTAVDAHDGSKQW